MVTSRRHGMRCWMRTSAAADGTLLTREVALLDGHGRLRRQRPARDRHRRRRGARAPTASRRSTCEGHCVYCNTPPSGSYRAFGATHLQWIGESQIDEVARRAGVDPLELRRRCLVAARRAGPPRRQPASRWTPISSATSRRAAAAVGWDEPRRPWVGRGVSVGLLAAGAHPVSRASVRLCSDGSADVYVGTTEMGQGPRTVMAQIAAEELGLSSDRVRVHGADTRFTPYDRSTGASRSTTVAGLAVKRAAEAVAARLRETAGELWDVDPDDRRAGSTGSARFAGEEISYPDLIAKRFGFRGGEIIEGGEVRPERRRHRLLRRGPALLGGLRRRRRGRGRPRHRRRHACCAPPPSPTSAGRSTRSSSSARTRARRCRASATRCSRRCASSTARIVNDSLLEYRVPRVGDLPRRDDARSSSRTPTGPGPTAPRAAARAHSRPCRRRSSARSPTRACRCTSCR